MLTMLAESGSGTLAGGAHSETFQAIARARAQKISALFQRRIDKPLLAKRFPGKPALAYFDLAAEESQDVGKIIDQVKGLEEAGYELDPEDVAERTGYRIVRRVGIPAQAAPAQNVPNREAPAKTEDVDAKAATVEKQLLGNALAQALQADQTDTRVLAVRLRELLEIAESDDPERLTLAMRNFREDLPDLARTLLANPSLADAIESALGAATANGLAEGTQRTEPNA
jgi:phage gp29-like protein